MGCTNSKPNVYTSDNSNKPQATPSTVPNMNNNSSPVEDANSSLSLNGPTSVDNPSKDVASTPIINKSDEKTEEACFGAGCYWGTEKFFRHTFAEQFSHLGSIKNGKVGFMGPPDAPANPTYREVCSGTTNHVEVYHFEYTGGTAHYEALVRYFFQFHDPTTKNRQGNDKGTQYASVIYSYNDEQKEIANRVKDELQALIDCGKLKPYSSKVVETDIRDSTVFYSAHEEHQDYLKINPNGYCNHRIRFKEWPKLEF